MKRIICSILVTLMVLAIMPPVAIAEFVDFGGELSNAINADNSNITFSTEDDIGRWEPTFTETERYATLVSPRSDSDSGTVTIQCSVQMSAGDVFCIETTTYQTNGSCDVSFYNEPGYYYDNRHNLPDGITQTFGFRAQTTDYFTIRISFSFDDYKYDDPMYIRVGNAQVFTSGSAPVYTLTYIDYRTLGTIATEQVELFGNAIGLQEYQIPVHKGFRYSGYDNYSKMNRITKDNTVYVMYELGADSPTGVITDINSFPLPEGVTLTNGQDHPWEAFASAEGVFIQSSNKHSNQTTSSFVLTLPNITSRKYLTFEYYISSEFQLDKLSWGIGQENNGEASGVKTQWFKEIIAIDETMSGAELSFAYSKDNRSYDGNDCATIRNIQIVDSYTVDYVYIDKYSDEIIVSGEVEYGSDITEPDLNRHEGMTVYGINLIHESDESLTYEVYYRDDYNAAGNIENGLLDISSPRVDQEDLSQADVFPYSVVTDADREFLRLARIKADDNDQGLLNIDCSEAVVSYTNPVLAFDYRAQKMCKAEITTGSETATFNFAPSDEWKTAYLPLSQAVGTVGLKTTEYALNLYYGTITVDYDNFRIFEGGEATITYHMQSGEGESTVQETVAKYSRFDYKRNPFGSVPENTYFFGYTETIEYVTEDIDVYARCLPTDRSTVFTDPNQSDISVDKYGDNHTIQFAPVFIDQREALGAVANELDYSRESLNGGLTIGVTTRPKPYLAMDVKIGQYESISISNSAHSSSRLLKDTAGEWVTIYLPVEAIHYFVLSISRSEIFRGISRPFETYISNIRFVDSCEKSTVTIKAVGSEETLGSIEVDHGTFVGELSIMYDILPNIVMPEGKVIARDCFVNPQSNVIIGDVTLYIELEDRISLDNALNAEGRHLEFTNPSPYQWKVEQMDGRTVAVPHSLYSPNQLSKIELTSAVQPGDLVSFDYRLLIADDKTELYTYFENSMFGVTQHKMLRSTAGEWETVTYECTQYEFSLLISATIPQISVGEGAYDPELVLAVDNFKIMPGNYVVTVRGTYGMTLGELEDQLPEGWSWADDSIVPDVINQGYGAVYEAPDSETFYSSNPNPTLQEVIILPFDFDNNQLTLTAAAKDGTLGSVELPAWLEWANPDTVLTTFNSELEFEAIVNRAATDQYNLTGESDSVMVKLTAYDMGDCDLNGEITAADAAALLRHVVGLSNMNALQQEAGNVDSVPGIDVSDAVAILRYIVRLQDSLYTPAVE